MKIVLLILGVLAGISVYAETSKKEYRKSFPKENIRELVISNKNGNVEVVQSAKDSVEIVAVVSVVAKSQNKADELNEYIQVKDEVADGYVSVTTEFGKDMTFNQLLSGVELNISYKVNLPEGIKLRLIHADGNVFIDNFSGDVNVDLKNCNFKGGNILDGEFLMKQTNGTFTVGHAGYLAGEFKACTVRIENANEAVLTLRDCQGRLESVEKLEIHSYGGDMRFGQIEDMSGTSSSTKYEVQDIGNSLKMDLRMGEINVRNIHFNFSTVDVTGSYSKVGLSFMEGAGYQLELKHNKSVRMDIPHSFKLTKRPTSEKNVTVETGFIGNKKYNGKVFLNLRNGNMYIQ